MPDSDWYSSPDAKAAAMQFLAPPPTATGFDNITQATVEAEVQLPEVQNAIRAATSSSEKALEMATVLNRVWRSSEGKSLRGTWSPPAMDSLRSALLFASAGLDVSLKRLVEHALPPLVDGDETVGTHFNTWAEGMLKNGQPTGVDAKSLVRILMTGAASPRAALLDSWVLDLTRPSAQSAERVQKLAQVLGVTNPTISKRIAPKPKPKPMTLLQEAFRERNKIAHGLDVKRPDAEVRKPLESIRERRSRPEIAKWCVELLDVTQVITNDVARRLPAL